MNRTERVNLQDAYVLHRRSYRETSLLLDVLTPDFGTLRIMAKGVVRKKGSRFAVLQPFVPLSISWVGRSELPLLCGAENRGSAWSLERKALFCGFYMNELVLRLLPSHDPHPGIFSLYERALSCFQAGGAPDEVLRFFELALLDEVGYGLALERDIETGSEIRAEKNYRYLVERGPLESVAGEDTIRGSTLLSLRAGHFSDPAEIGEAKRLMRRVINHHLGGRPLKSRELFRFIKSN